MLPTRFFRDHVKTCLKMMKQWIPVMASEGQFRRVQATCSIISPSEWFRVLGFLYEGTLAKFGPNGESCMMFARVFEVEQ